MSDVEQLISIINVGITATSILSGFMLTVAITMLIFYLGPTDLNSDLIPLFVDTLWFSTSSLVLLLSALNLLIVMRIYYYYQPIEMVKISDVIPLIGLMFFGVSLSLLTKSMGDLIYFSIIFQGHGGLTSMIKWHDILFLIDLGIVFFVVSYSAYKIVKTVPSPTDEPDKT